MPEQFEQVGLCDAGLFCDRLFRTVFNHCEMRYAHTGLLGTCQVYAIFVFFRVRTHWPLIAASAHINACGALVCLPY